MAVIDEEIHGQVTYMSNGPKKLNAIAKGGNWEDEIANYMLGPSLRQIVNPVDLPQRVQAAIPQLKQNVNAILDHAFVVFRKQMISMAAECCLSEVNEAEAAFSELDRCVVVSIETKDSFFPQDKLSFALASPKWVKKSLITLKKTLQGQGFRLPVCQGDLFRCESIKQLHILHKDLFVFLLLCRSMCNAVKPVFTADGAIEGLEDVTEEILAFVSPKRILDELRIRGVYLLIPSLILEQYDTQEVMVTHQEEEYQDTWEASFQLSFKVPLPGVLLSQLLSQLQRRLGDSVTVRTWKYGLFSKSKDNVVNVAFRYIGSSSLSYYLKVDVTSLKRSDPVCSELWTRLRQILDVLVTTLDTRNYSPEHQQIIFSDAIVFHFDSASASGLTCELSLAAGSDGAVQKLLVISVEGKAIV